MTKYFIDSRPRWEEHIWKHDTSLVDELLLETNDGDFEGVIGFYRLDNRIYPRLHVFSDQWKSPLFVELAQALWGASQSRMSEFRLSIDEIKQVLLDHGFEDWTEKDR